MNIKYLVAVIAVLPLTPALASMDADPVLYSLRFEELELRSQDGSDALVWDASAWIGRDRDRLWFKTEGERTSAETDEFELQALYSRAVSPYWNLQLGWRGDFQPVQERNWATVALEGLAPGFIETEAALFMRSGAAAARVKLAYDLRLSQRAVLEPSLEVDWYSKDDPVNGLGSGLARSELGLRLRYEWRRDFAPYIGLNWHSLYGETADLSRAEGGKSRDLQWVAGLRVWF